MCGLDADSHKVGVRGGIVQRAQHVGAEGLVVHDILVCRNHHHVRLGVEGAEVIRRQRHARCRAPEGRLAQDVQRVYLGQLLLNQLHVRKVG